MIKKSKRFKREKLIIFKVRQSKYKKYLKRIDKKKNEKKEEIYDDDSSSSDDDKSNSSSDTETDEDTEKKRKDNQKFDETNSHELLMNLDRINLKNIDNIDIKKSIEIVGCMKCMKGNHTDKENICNCKCHKDEPKFVTFASPFVIKGFTKIDYHNAFFQLHGNVEDFNNESKFYESDKKIRKYFHFNLDNGILGPYFFDGGIKREYFWIFQHLYETVMEMFRKNFKPKGTWGILDLENEKIVRKYDSLKECENFVKDKKFVIQKFH
jgi:hypothetical protein